jgi:hypothetical protein
MKRLAVISGVSVGLLGILFLTTDPQHVPSFLLIIPFILLAILLFGIIRLVLYFFTVSNTKSRQIAVIGSAIPTLLLGLQSIGQLTVRDAGTIALLTGLSYFYISRLAKQKAA